LPLLEKEYNPALVPALCRLAEICREEDDFLQQAALPVYREALLEEEPDRLVLSAGVLRRQPVALRRRVVRLAFGRLGGGRELSYRHVHSVLALLDAGCAGTEAVLPGGVRARRSYATVELTAARRAAVPPYVHRLRVPGSTGIPEAGCSIEALVLFAGGWPDPPSLPPTEALFDFDLLPEGLAVRRRLPGDVFTPLGGGKTKLKDFLIKQKVPREERDRLPVVTAGGEIIWVGGVRPAEKWKITPGTKRALHLRIEKGFA